jgi:hypothetical protein
LIEIESDMGLGLRPPEFNLASKRRERTEFVQLTLSRDDARAIHGLLSDCTLDFAPDTQLSADAFRGMIRRTVENAGFGHAKLSAAADKIGAALAREE